MPFGAVRRVSFVALLAALTVPACGAGVFGPVSDDATGALAVSSSGWRPRDRLLGRRDRESHRSVYML